MTERSKAMNRCRHDVLSLQVGPWSRMKRKTVGGVVPDNIPAAQRARTEAAIQVRACAQDRRQHSAAFCSVLSVTSYVNAFVAALCSWWRISRRLGVLTRLMVCCAQAGKVTVTAPNPLFISADAISRKAR